MRGFPLCKHDTLSPVAPYRLVNIGNSKMVSLNEFISAIELVLGKKAKKNLLPIQVGDVPATWASNSLLKELTKMDFRTDVNAGVRNFISWYKEYSQTSEGKNNGAW